MCIETNIKTAKEYLKKFDYISFTDTINRIQIDYYKLPRYKQLALIYKDESFITTYIDKHGMQNYCRKK